MPRSRDRASATGLLPRMEARPWADGKRVTYRYHPVGGKPINLGTDREQALRKVLDMNGETPHHGSLRWVWEQFQTAKRWKKLADGTRADYETAWSQLDKHMGGMPVESITAPMVARYVHIARADSPRRADIEKTLLSNLCKHAIMLGVGLINPTVGVEPHGSTPSRVMPADTVLRAFLAWLDTRPKQQRIAGLMSEFIARAGSRRAEFIGLVWLQVDLDGRVARLKRAKQRGVEVWDRIDLSDELVAVLKRAKALNPDSPYVFPTRDGGVYTASGWKSLWQRVWGAAVEDKVVPAGARFNFHSLRRYYTTNHRAEYGTLPELHADPRVTSRVYDATKEVGRKSL